MRAMKEAFVGPIFNKYRDWLINKCNLKAKNKNYSKLFELLLISPYIFNNLRDKNRAMDGLDLRYEFKRENKIDDTFEDSVSLLEVLIALSIRVDNEYIGDPSKPNPDRFFWEMIKNVGLDNFTNTSFDKSKFNFVLDQIYSDRRNFFLMRGSKEEMWTQMLAYISTHNM